MLVFIVCIVVMDQAPYATVDASSQIHCKAKPTRYIRVFLVCNAIVVYSRCTYTQRL
jgi:hypothetical protein